MYGWLSHLPWGRPAGQTDLFRVPRMPRMRGDGFQDFELLHRFIPEVKVVGWPIIITQPPKHFYPQRSPINPATVLKINHLYESALRWHYIFLWSDNPSKVTRKINTTTEQRWKSLNLAIHFSFSNVPEKRLILFSVLWKVWFEKKLFSIRSYFAPDSNVMYAKLHPISFVQTEIFQLFAEIFSISMLCNTWLSVDSSLPAEAYHVTQPSLYRSSHQIHLQISELRQMRFLELLKQYIKTLRIANGPAHLLLAIPGLQIKI